MYEMDHEERKKIMDKGWMQRALDLAEEAKARGEVPTGAVIVHAGQAVGKGYNRRETDRDPTAHAEIIAILHAARSLDRWRLSGCTIYVTKEPCPMCAGAIYQARIDRLVYGCPDPKGGAAGSLYQICDDPRLNHRLQVETGLLEDECAEQLRDFFQELRKQE